MVNFDTQYTINYLSNNTNNKKSVLKNDDDYFNSVIKKFNFSEKTKEEQGYNGSADVKEIENSLYKRYMEDKLSKDEIKILNKFGTDYLTEGVDLSALHKRKVDLLKTLASMNEFEKIWGAERAQREKQFFNELGKPLTQEDIDRFLTNKNNQKEDKEAFKPIQAESKNKETYKDDNTRNELVKKLLEDKFSTSKELELLFGMKFSDDTGEFNKILSLNSAPKSIDIKA
ncbi:TPA: hypothetical protein SAO79_000591 [Campylobacter jejuni]|uniref:Uncharacterized protein n=1 Tax=Campylobacter jejuni TaxID=197 RepID=A0AAX0NKR1_CAMJU|nr:MULTISPECIES: hypothetical protein [Campylobacter]EAH9714516.1 hypothetical protein [Campylobacter jejuni]EAI2775079.1 hypothetical protein [Campylobacter jejuni]EAI2863202.1 hypothetical protein [Campylobacter jejuni]EAJ8916931.1 hypothetical protein [Campylobacter jejuni]EAK1144799.1 hypothetical protein [Campylobacter jejuni]